MEALHRKWGTVAIYRWHEVLVGQLLLHIIFLILYRGLHTWY